jgi:hypothetical protein
MFRAAFSFVSALGVWGIEKLLVIFDTNEFRKESSSLFIFVAYQIW